MSNGNLPPPPPDSSGSGVDLPGGRVLASPWARIGARLLDGLILGVVSSVIIVGLTGGDGIDRDTSGWGLAIVSLLLAVIYEVGFVGAAGGTPGKLILGLRIVAQEDGRTPPGWDKAVLRVRRWPRLIGDRGAVALLARDRRPPAHRVRPGGHHLRRQGLGPLTAATRFGQAPPARTPRLVSVGRRGRTGGHHVAAGVPAWPTTSRARRPSPSRRRRAQR